MMSKPSSAAVIVATLLTGATAYADDFEIGARVGGYGFRRDFEKPWDECRMNGMGVFGARALPGPLFVEAGIDMYSSVDPQPSDLPLDRTSGLFSGAIGARTQ